MIIYEFEDWGVTVQAEHVVDFSETPFLRISFDRHLSPRMARDGHGLIVDMPRYAWTELMLPWPEWRGQAELWNACRKLDERTRHTPKEYDMLPSFYYDLTKVLS